jgi:hypothetical protein
MIIQYKVYRMFAHFVATNAYEILLLFSTSIIVYVSERKELMRLCTQVLVSIWKYISVKDTVRKNRVKPRSIYEASANMVISYT